MYLPQEIADQNLLPEKPIFLLKELIQALVCTKFHPSPEYGSISLLSDNDVTSEGTLLLIFFTIILFA
jgi:hypothetical protein